MSIIRNNPKQLSHINVRIEIEKGIKLSIDALNTCNFEHGAQILEVLKSFFEQPYAGRGLGIGTFHHRGFRNSFENVKFQLQSQQTLEHKLAWENALLTLFDIGNYSATDMFEWSVQVQDDIIFNHLLKHIIANLLVGNHMEEAEGYIKHFRKRNDADNQDQGYLLMLDHYAGQGNADQFFKYLKLGVPVKNKHHISENKAWLVESYAAKNSIQSAIALCRHKTLGEKYLFNALLVAAAQGLYQDLKAIFKESPELKQPEQQTELKILVKAYLEASQRNIDTDDDFDELFSQVALVDRKLKWGDFNLQDGLLLELGMAAKGNKDRVNKCKKAMKNNQLKKELS